MNKQSTPVGSVAAPTKATTIREFRRVKGSGTFRLDDFCAITGLEEERAQMCLMDAVEKGEVVPLDGIFLLKPLRRKQKAGKHDWQLSVQRQKRIYAACPARSVAAATNKDTDGATFKSIIERVPMGHTTLKRYLRVMTVAGILVSQKIRTTNYYWQGQDNFLEGSYWEFWKKQDQTSGAVTSAPTQGEKPC